MFLWLGLAVLAPYSSSNFPQIWRVSTGRQLVLPPPQLCGLHASTRVEKSETLLFFSLLTVYAFRRLFFCLQNTACRCVEGGRARLLVRQPDQQIGAVLGMVS